MLDFLKRKIAFKVGEEEGKRLPTKAIDFLKRNKMYISGPFLAVTTWAFVKQCPPLVIFDIPFSPANYMSCSQINIVVALLGGLFLGAGVINSDSYHKARQGKADVEIKVIDKESGEEVPHK